MSREPTRQRHSFWHDDPGARLLLIALAIVLAVFLVALTLMEGVAG